MSQDDHATQIQGCIDRLRSGDAAARDELLAPRLGAADPADAEDAPRLPGRPSLGANRRCLQNAVLRLCRALGEVQPPTDADFFRLAAANPPRAARSRSALFRAHGLGAHHASVAGRTGPSGRRRPEPADTTHDPDRLAAWSDFHREVEALPAEDARPSTCSSTRACPRQRRRPCWMSLSERSSAAGRRRGCAWSRRWEARCPASEPISTGGCQ